MDGRRPTRNAFGALLISAAAALAVAGSAHAAMVFRPCEEAPKSPSRCSTVTVPLDRSGTVPGVVDLHVRTLAPGGTATGAVLELAGGPGQPGTEFLDANADELGSILAHRTLITFDSRGTGQSDRLQCVSFALLYPLTEATTRCANELGPRRAFYATSDSVADIESVRVALGVDKLIVVGTSYGTKVAQRYAAAYPDHVERLVLDSTVSTADADPITVSTVQAIPGMLRNVCRGGACPFTSDTVADLAALVAKVRARPLHTVIYNFDGRPRTGRITEATVLAEVLEADIHSALRASLPAAIHSALLGDGGPLLTLDFPRDTYPTPAADDFVNDTDFIATLCEDGGTLWPAGTPLADRGPLVAAAVAALAPDAVAPFAPRTVNAVTGRSQFCLGWPESPIAQTIPPPAVVPTLLLSGTDDLRTPPADAAAIAATLPDAQLLSVPDVGHSVVANDPTGCTKTALHAFVDGTPIATCPVPARQPHPVAAISPASLDAVAPIPGLPRKIGRTLAAVRATLPDLRLRAALSRDTSRRFIVGGLRGGTAAFLGATILLDRYRYVPGVTLSGRLATGRGGGRLRIGGIGATGTLRYDTKADRISGRLDGRKVSLRVPEDLLLEADSHPVVGRRAPS